MRDIAIFVVAAAAAMYWCSLPTWSERRYHRRYEEAFVEDGDRDLLDADDGKYDDPDPADYRFPIADGQLQFDDPDDGLDRSGASSLEKTHYFSQGAPWV